MSETNWQIIKRDFLLGDKNLKELAKIHGIHHGTLRNKACSEKWSEIKKNEKQELNTKITNEILKEQLTSELEIRLKNFNSGTVCLDRGLERLSKLQDNEIPPQLAIKMVELGIKARHTAAGLPDRYEMKFPQPDSDSPTVEDAIEDHQKQMKLLDELLFYSEAIEKKKALNVVSEGSKS